MPETVSINSAIIFDKELDKTKVKLQVVEAKTIDKDILNKVMAVAQNIGKAQIKALGAKGVNILSNVGEYAGQSVKHFHVHVIPRYNKVEERLKLEFKEREEFPQDLPEIADNLKKEL